MAACGPSPRPEAGKPPTADPAQPSENGVVLQGKAALDVLQQCSRSTPSDVRETWMPSAAQIAALEAKLGPVLASARGPMLHAGPPRRLDDYARQYAGIVHPDGTRGIYVNGFVRVEIHLVARHGDDTLRWRESPVLVCDGGAGFFGVEYHPDTGTFGPLQFNGVA
jgi:hypothetical protein